MKASESTRTRLRVVMVVANNGYPRDVRVRQEAETLARAGYGVTVVAPADPGEPSSDVIAGVEVVRYPPPPEARNVLGYFVEYLYGTLAVVCLVTWVWWRKGLDVLHAHNPPDTLFVAGLLPKLFGKRFVFDHHDLAPELFRAKFERRARMAEIVAGALRALERLSCRIADRVVTVNRSYQDVDVARNGVDRERVVVVRNGPPIARLDRPDEPADVRGGAAIVVGYLGNIAVQDGVDHLVRALHHLERDFGCRDWAAVVIGPADDPGSLERLAEELGVARKIRFVGYQPDVVWRAMLAHVDICCVPDPPSSLNEKSTMIKTMEYMALGKPVVAYDMIENRVSAGDAALYARPGEPIDVARQFERLAGDADLRMRMGDNGRRRIREGLAWEYSAEALLDMYAGMEAEFGRATPSRNGGSGSHV